MTHTQLQYNRAIDNLTYLVLNYPKPVQELLSFHNVFFKGKPSKSQLINEIVELVKDENTSFINDLEGLIEKFSAQENDAFLGIVKGALGIVGGLLGKKRRRRSSGNSGASAAAAQAAAAKRDMERRMAEMRAAQERQRQEAERRRREEQRRRREEATRKAKEAADKKQRNTMMLVIGGGVVLVGIVLVVALKPKPQLPYSPYGAQANALPQTPR